MRCATGLWRELSSLLEASRQEDVHARAEAEARAAAKRQALAQARAPDVEAAEAAFDDEADTSEPGQSSAAQTERHRKRTDTNGESMMRFSASRRARRNASAAARQMPRYFASPISRDSMPMPISSIEFRYRQTIRDMIAAVMAAEAPIREDILAKRIARAHGWLRTGSRIRDQIALHLRDLDRTDEQTGRFLWPKGSV